MRNGIAKPPRTPSNIVSKPARSANDKTPEGVTF